MSASATPPFYPHVPPLSIELTSRCNLRCPYCSNPNLHRQKGEMEGRLVDRLVGESRREGYVIAGVHGVGEPLLRADLEGILALIAPVWSTRLVTNGTLLNAARAQRLVAAGMRFVYVSLDTLDPDLYRRTRGGDVARVIANVRDVAALYPEMPITIGLMNHREQVVDHVVRACFDTTFEGRPSVRLASYENARFPGAAADWRRLVVGPDGTLAAPQTAFCAAPASFLTIDAEGRVALCCVDQQSEHVLGSVWASSIRDIWYDPRNQATFRDIGLGLRGVPEVCLRCVLAPPRRTLDDVDPLSVGSLPGLVAAARGAGARGDSLGALELMETALRRSPYDGAIHAEVLDLAVRAGRSAQDYFQQYMKAVS